MNNRITSDQITHDNVIEVVKNMLDKTNHDVYTNPGSEKNAGIGDNYPDIIITEKDSKNVQIIIEVETDKSIDDNEAQQWIKYATEINASFYVLVPLLFRNQVQNLINKFNIQVRVGTYFNDGSKWVIKYD